MIVRLDDIKHSKTLIDIIIIINIIMIVNDTALYHKQYCNRMTVYDSHWYNQLVLLIILPISLDHL